MGCILAMHAQHVHAATNSMPPSNRLHAIIALSRTVRMSKPLHAHLRQRLQWLFVDVRQAAGQAKPAQLHAPVFIQQDVGGLQVTVDDFLAVEVLHRHYEIACKVVHGRLWQPHILPEQRHEVAADAILQDEPQVVGGLIPAPGSTPGIRDELHSGASWLLPTCVCRFRSGRGR